jgi:hypothetical protein
MEKPLRKSRIVAALAFLLTISMAINIYIYWEWKWRSIPLVWLYTEGALVSDLGVAEVLMERGGGGVRNLLIDMIESKIFDWEMKEKLSPELFSCDRLNDILEKKDKAIKWLGIKSGGCF